MTNEEERQELARGLSYSSKADMYSFGCLLYELIHLECESRRLTQVILTLITHVTLLGIRLPSTARVRETRRPVLMALPQNFAPGFQNIMESLLSFSVGLLFRDRSSYIALYR